MMGGFFYPSIEYNQDNYLLFNNPVFELSLDGLKNAMDFFPSSPFIFKKRFYWPEDIKLDNKKGDMRPFKVQNRPKQPQPC
jgi:hypothetical protein